MAAAAAAVRTAAEVGGRGVPACRDGCRGAVGPGRVDDSVPVRPRACAQGRAGREGGREGGRQVDGGPSSSWPASCAYRAPTSTSRTRSWTRCWPGARSSWRGGRREEEEGGGGGARHGAGQRHHHCHSQVQRVVVRAEPAARARDSALDKYLRSDGENERCRRVDETWSPSSLSMIDHPPWRPLQTHANWGCILPPPLTLRP